MSKLKTTVHVRDESGLNVEFGPHSKIPGWAEKAITNPKAWAEAPDVQEEAPDPSAKPPKAGKGSSVEVWAAYAEHIGVTVPSGAERGDIIAAVESHETEIAAAKKAAEGGDQQ